MCLLVTRQNKYFLKHKKRLLKPDLTYFKVQLILQSSAILLKYLSMLINSHERWLSLIYVISSANTDLKNILLRFEVHFFFTRVCVLRLATKKQFHDSIPAGCSTQSVPKNKPNQKAIPRIMTCRIRNICVPQQVYEYQPGVRVWRRGAQLAVQMINVIMCGFALWSDAIDSHRSPSDKHGLAGKREMPIEEDFKTGKKHAPPVGTHQCENPKRIHVN